MKKDEILLTYAGIEDQIRRARLQRSIYLAEAIGNAVNAFLGIPSRILARLERARREAPPLSSARRLAPR